LTFLILHSFHGYFCEVAKALLI